MESFEKFVAFASATPSDNWFESGHKEVLRKYFNDFNDDGVQADG